MIRTLHPAARRSAGFTLIELLVVIGIIGVLMSLLAAGVFRYLDVQAASNTETTIRTVDKVLRQHIDSVLQTADKEPLPASVIAFATSNNTVLDPQQKRARVIWKTLRLIQEFPMTYDEVGWKGTPGSPIRDGLPFVGPYKDLWRDLPPKASYVKALKSALRFPQGTATAGEASTLLLLALQQPRSGVTFNADELYSAAQDTNGDGLKEIVDGWGNPIAFYRFPTGNPNDPNYLVTPAADLDRSAPAGNPLFRNPLDPEGELLKPAWNNPKSPQYNTSEAHLFEQVCHLIHDPKTGLQRAYNTPFVIVSAGRGGTFGFNDEKFGFRWYTDSMGAQLGSMSVTDLGAANDNIYSYRLKLGARGD